MSAAWSWASLAAAKKENQTHCISKIVPNLSTCPKIQSNGQVGKLFQPLEYIIADWQEFYDERASIAEHDGRISHEEAKRVAYESCIEHWINRSPPACSSPTTCPQCEQDAGANDLAVLTSTGTHIWLHDKCHASWLARRRQKAAVALEKMGILPIAG